MEAVATAVAAEVEWANAAAVVMATGAAAGEAAGNWAVSRVGGATVA